MLKLLWRVHKFRLRTTLVIPFVLQITTAIGLVSYISFVSAQQAVNQLSAQLRTELTARIKQELERYLSTPHDINQFNVSAMRLGDINFTDPTNISQMLQQVKLFPSIFGTYCGSEAGDFLGTGREASQNNQIYFWSVNADTNYNFYYYGIDSSGNRQGFIADYGAYDPRQRPWYQEALKQQRETWSEIYLDFSTQQPTLTAAKPVYDQNNQLLGVCATDIQLSIEFRQFLSNLQIGKTGQAFIMDRSGKIISSSTQEPLIVGEGENAKLIQAAGSKNSLIQETFRYLSQEFGAVQNIETAQQFDFSLKGQQHFVQVLPLEDNRGLDWLIVVTIPASDFMDQIYATTRYTLFLTLAALGVAIGLGILTARWITQPILRIAIASEDISAGKLDQHVRSSSIVELDTLASAFNSMASQLKNSFKDLKHREQELEKLLIAYDRFVPNEYLNFLEKDSVVDINLGDHVQKEMSILFADIRNFTTLSETMTPEENFRFINSYLSYMEPAILENHGFIDKYIGDGIMALFPGTADDAVRAGIAILSRLKAYNEHRNHVGHMPIEVGIGINTGPLMLGTVGSENRMESTVISDAVNVASRIESLTKNYGVSLLISQNTFDGLETSNSYSIREIDTVRVRGKSEPVTIYEVFQVDYPPIQAQKLVTLDLFQQAISLYRLCIYDQAEQLFQECLDKNPYDYVARVYLNRCQANSYQFQVNVLEESFALLSPKSEEFTALFYEFIFHESVEIKAMFAYTDLRRQREKLWQSLQLIIENLRRPDLLSGALKGLGATHLQYGVLPEHYPLVGEAILYSLSACLGPTYTLEVKQAWADAYATIQQLMVSGAAEIIQQQSSSQTWS